MISITSENIYQKIVLNDMLIAMEAAILAHDEGRTHTAQRTHINSGKNTFLMMSCFGEKYFCTKLISVFPDNVDKHIPTLYRTVILNNGHTRELLAILDPKAITTLRTGAIGGLSVKHLVPKNIENIGMFKKCTLLLCEN